MARTATVTAADPATERRAVLDRVLARAKPPEGSYQIDTRTGQTVRTEARVAPAERLPAADLGEWIDDRIVACFGSRVRLNPVEAVAYGILQAMRAGDLAGIAAATRKGGSDLDALEQHSVWQLLEHWRAAAPRFAQDAARAALTEARQLGWDERPSRRALEKAARTRAAAAPRADLDAEPGRALSPGAEKLLGKRTAAA